MRPRVEPELVLLVVVFVSAIVSRVVFTRTRTVRNVMPEGRIRVCLSAKPHVDTFELVMRYTSASSRRYEIVFGLLIECERMEDALDVKTETYPCDVRVHHTVALPAENHTKRHAKLHRKFVNGLEDLVVLSDPQVVPEFAWDLALMNAFQRSDEWDLVTCPLCQHVTGFPTLRERSNGDVVRDEAKAFLHRDETTGVASVCLCNEFVAFRPVHVPPFEDARVGVPTFPLLRPVSSRIEDEVLDTNLHPLRASLLPSEKLGLSLRPSGDELYHKYGSATAAKLAVRLDRRKRQEAQRRGE